LKQILVKYILENISENESKWNLVIIFSPEDCPYCLEEISYWLDFKEKKNKFECLGLVDHPHKELTLNFIKSMGWKFSKLIIEENLFGENFGLGKTPIKVLLNENNKIYYLEGPLPNWKKESILKKLIEDLKIN